MASKKTPEDVKRDLLRKTQRFSKLFSSPEGKEVLRDLENEFERRTSVVEGDPYATHRKEGERFVVLYIKDMITIGEKTNETHEQA